MSERFTREGRDVVVRARAEALRLSHPYIGTEHLLLGVLAGSAASLATPLDLELARREVIRVLGCGDPDQGLDAEGLEALGIDLDRVRRRVEASFGPGALQSRSSSCAAPGRVRFTKRAKRSRARAA